MEQVRGTHKESKFESEDIISTMPDNVITNILNCMPLEDAMGTALVARNWRFKWTLLTKLVLDKEFSEYLQLQGPNGEYVYDWRNISRLLLHIKGPITKFLLHIPNNKVLDVEDITHWVLFLSQKGMNEFSLINMHETTLKLPSHLFSCLELKHLKLRNCCLYQAPSFCGFPNLMTLDFYRVTIEGGKYGEIFSRSPSLEMLKISYHDPTRNLKLVEIAKLGNLIKLSLPLCKLDNIVDTSSSIFELGGYLHKLQELYLDFRNHKFLGKAYATNLEYIFFPCLKSLTLYPIDFSNGAMFSCVFGMIRASPNLQNLKITATYYAVVQLPEFSYQEVDDNIMGLLQLQSVVLSSFRGSENEVHLIKYLLGSSPLLKKMVIQPTSSVVFGGDDGKFIFARKLLQLHRASTIAEVDLY